MFNHIFKLIWNKKRQNALLMAEIFASFMVLFAVGSLSLYYWNNYRQSLGFSYENVWVLSYNGFPPSANDTVVGEQSRRIKHQLLTAYQEIESASVCSANTPFSMSTSNRGIRRDTSGMEVLTNFFSVDENYQKALNIEMMEGRWFTAYDKTDAYTPVVINRQLKDKLFSADEKVAGQVLQMDDDEKYRVVGVTGNFKPRSEFQDAIPCMFEFAKEMSRWCSILIKVKDGADAADFEARLMRDLNALSPDYSLEMTIMADQRRNQHAIVMTPVVIALVVSGFLLVNVMLGLFGVLWYNIRKRREEIGLRRALGATGGQISNQFVGEALVIAAFGVLVGLFFAAQFPLMNVFGLEARVYWQAIGLAMVAIGGLVLLCSFYPSRLAASVQPADALHEE